MYLFVNYIISKKNEGRFYDARCPSPLLTRSVCHKRLSAQTITMEGDEYDVSQPAPNRCIDVELSGQEIITIDLDALDSDPLDYIELLREANARVPMWTKLACEYWRNGLLDAAQQCIDHALKSDYNFGYDNITFNVLTIFFL